MKIPRIYTPQEINSNTHLQLDERSGHHCAQVLRLRVGDSVVVFNGLGGEFPAEITRIRKSEVSLETKAKREVNRESPIETTLYQAITRGDRMDYAIQKAVELGVNRIVPLFTERCVVKLDEKKCKSRLAHWHGIIISACEQSARTSMVGLENPVQASQVSLAQPDCCHLLFHPETELQLHQVQPEGDKIGIFIGPEGGWTDMEVNMMRDKGVQVCRLGPRILRTETATVSALSAIQLRWGDLNK